MLWTLSCSYLRLETVRVSKRDDVNYTWKFVKFDMRWGKNCSSSARVRVGNPILSGRVV